MRVDRAFDETFRCSKAARNEVLYEKKITYFACKIYGKQSG